jgi:hypothetical protein
VGPQRVGPVLVSTGLRVTVCNGVVFPGTNTTQKETTVKKNPTKNDSCVCTPTRKCVSV